MKVRENHVIFEYSDNVQGIPGYNRIISSENALFMESSKNLCLVMKLEMDMF